MGYVLCVRNAEYPASLELWKLYPRLEPLANDPPGFVRVVDEDGEDYLYPQEHFRAIELPRGILALLRARTTRSPPVRRSGSTRR